jgi:hypothetical protein
MWSRKSDYTFFLVVTILLVLSTLVGCVTFYKIYQKMNYEAKINDNWWKIHWEDIKFADRTLKKNTSSIGALWSTRPAFLTHPSFGHFFFGLFR